MCATVNIGENGRLTRIAEISEDDSIGRLYSIVTYYFGMSPLEHEYKVMGLAPYVTDRHAIKEKAQLFTELFEFNVKNPMVWQRKRHVPAMAGAYRWITKRLYRQRFDLVMAGLQYFLEKMLQEWVRNCIQETGIRRVACSGGVFMNVKANKEVLHLPEVEELFVFPSCGDETNAIGAAYLVYARQRLENNEEVDVASVENLYWGDDFSDSEVEEVLKQRQKECPEIKFKHFPDIDSHVAQMIADGKVVARAKGRCEFGARALGNRSILARPDDMKAVRIINDMIKCRDFWMPFAPMVLAERAEEYYLKPKPIHAPFMIMAFDSRPETRDKFVAALHPYDYTVRPQEVSETSNPSLYQLLKHYEERTGEGILLNTSFNLHGYPIVYRPEDALYVLRNSGLQNLALGNWLVWKE